LRLEQVSREFSGTRWFDIRAVPLDRPEGGAVITHTEISKQKLAELRAQQARQKLSHVSRVSTMGALITSIAHELNQPLTGVITNAQAAQRFLAAARPNTEEVWASLRDIVEDGRRAADVVVRLREFLRRDRESIQVLDLNVIVATVVGLVGDDALVRNVGVVLQLDSPAVIVRGARAQLEQVVLNLLVNALDSMVDQQVGERRIVARCGVRASDVVEVSVNDTGSGFQPGATECAFDAFYTTKPNGMGLGLFIARSIVEAHTGTIRATNNVDKGATVTFRLPLAQNHPE
jgi:two-component system sensor kinase FixL